MELRALKKIKPSYLVLTLALGILLVFLSGAFSKSPTPKEEHVEKMPEETDTCAKLEEIIESIEGVSNVKIFISYENKGVKKLAKFGEESVAIDKDQKKSSSKNEAVIISNGSEEAPFVNEEILPEVRGVIISAKGINTSELEAKIIDAVSTALGVAVHKVKIV